MRLGFSLGNEVNTCSVAPRSLRNSPACSHSTPHQTKSPQIPEEAQAGPGAEQGCPVVPSTGRAEQARTEHMVGSPSSEGTNLHLPFLLGPQL